MHRRSVSLLPLLVLLACDDSSGPEPGCDCTPPAVVATVPVPQNYGIHDTYVRDGLAFVSAWNSGMLIYDVGNGRNGGSPDAPKLVSSIITSANGISGGPAVHNSWWFHNPVTGEKRYLFIGQEGPTNISGNATGDIHIVDVSDLAQPVEVGFIRVPQAGAHNFWMDESRQVLYAAYYNGGVIAVNVSGTLTGDMSNRITAQTRMAGDNTFTWGVMLAGNTLYASDMGTGLWALDPVTLATKGGGNNVNERTTSDLWITGAWGYTGTWGVQGNVRGNVVKVWSISASGIPTLADSIIIENVLTVSDVAVSPDGTKLVVTTENGFDQGLYVYDRTDPKRPALLGSLRVAQGLHTGEVAVINGRTLVFAARNPPNPALMIIDITDVSPD